MLVSSNNDVSLRKAFEELSISSQVNCGFYNKNEKIKTSKPIETEWMDDEEHYPYIDYAYRLELVDSDFEIESKFDPFVERISAIHTPRYLEPGMERDKDINYDEDEEEDLRFKRYFGEGGVYWEPETSCIDETEPPIAPSKNRYVLLSYLKDTNLDDYEDLQLRYE
uniref:Uncharacterized protein n=1 Tax=Polytomella parva TaxID=51329 RepID=A0A7S0VLW8_9CHLO|mmetsp:Transcript_630/g.776  ORF Transcript_630/g.776 Transcript_630/m.776 type:complete len:167 (+) Transcript_630:100-600(+)